MEYRMYVLVLKQLSGIDKGIQAAHACLEYALKYGETNDYRNYINNDKTIIVLNGGTSSDFLNIYNTLQDANINFGYFKEPDLNNTITAICFLVDKLVYDAISLDRYLEHFYLPKIKSVDGEVNYEKGRLDYIEYIGGETNFALKTIISGKHLAR